MRMFRILMFMLVAMTAVASAQSPAITKASTTITPADVQKRIEFLASDALRGRDTPSPGLEQAAAYIAAEFKSFGLKPAGDSGTYIQRWPFKVAKVDVANIQAELRGGTNRTLAFGKDFFVIPSTMVDTLTGDIVYGGVAGSSSIPATAFTGKVPAFFIAGGMPDKTWEGALQAAFTAAMGANAKGVVFILDPQFPEQMVQMVSQMVAGQNAPMPIVAITYAAAKEWLKTMNVDLDAARQATTADALGKGSLFVRTSSGGVVNRVPNVVGILEGSDPALKNTYVVYSAHMDHVGVGQPDATGDSIYNGADDDASGTTAVLEIAQAYASMPTRPKRSIIFLLVSGEEKGLFGSAHFVQNPPVPVKQIVADINIDMIGRNAADSTVAIGMDYTSLGATMKQVNKAHPELKLTVAPDLWPEENLFVRSDHFNFAKAEIPAIFFTSGLHADYHKPSDEPETIDNDKLARTAKLLFFLGNEVAGSATAPTWTEAGLKVIKAN
jgi:hypothetical protein